MTYSGNEPNGDTPSGRSLEQEVQDIKDWADSVDEDLDATHERQDITDQQVAELTERVTELEEKADWGDSDDWFRSGW